MTERSRFFDYLEKKIAENMYGTILIPRRKTLLEKIERKNASNLVSSMIEIQFLSTYQPSPSLVWMVSLPSS